MNNIYVNKLPDCCVQCSLCCADYKGELYCKQLDETFKPNIEVVDYKKRKENCPLKLLSDRLTEERKKVVQEIRDWCDKNGIVVDTFFDHKTLKRIESRMCYVHEINKQLNQIERGE